MGKVEMTHTAEGIVDPGGISRWRRVLVKHGAGIAIEIELDERGRWERPRLTAWWRSGRHQAVSGCVRVLQSAAGAAGWRF